MLLSGRQTGTTKEAYLVCLKKKNKKKTKLFYLLVNEYLPGFKYMKDNFCGQGAVCTPSKTIKDNTDPYNST